MSKEPIYMPKFGMTMTQGLILEWYVATGDEVTEGDPLLAVETEKVNSDVEATASGTLLEIVHDAGEEVEAGTIVGYIGKEGGA